MARRADQPAFGPEDIAIYQEEEGPVWFVAGRRTVVHEQWGQGNRHVGRGSAHTGTVPFILGTVIQGPGGWRVNNLPELGRFGSLDAAVEAVLVYREIIAPPDTADA